MISWITGTVIEEWGQGSRCGVLLSCKDIGYEIQILPNFSEDLNPNSKLILWIHQVRREDGDHLFGFKIKGERDLFRQLISVSGIGPQVGMALLTEYKVPELIQAIVESDQNKLSKAAGVGRKTAERLSVELKKKLSNYSDLRDKGLINVSSEIQVNSLDRNQQTDLHKTLKGLGYEDLEIRRGIKAVSEQKQPESLSATKFLGIAKEESDELLREILVWLSNEAS